MTDTSPNRVPVALTIAGSDSSGGAGIQADLKTFAAFGVYGASVITALTAQNTRGVAAIEPVSGAFIAAQIRAVATDLSVAGIKTGMLGTGEAIRAVLAGLPLLGAAPLIVDPVMVASSGDRLLDEDALDLLRQELLPRAVLVTPNLPEAALLLGAPQADVEAAVVRQGEAILKLGPKLVLMKGGHAESSECADILLDGTRVLRFASPRITTRNTHGTGCTLSAAIVALLVGGTPLEEAVARAKAFVSRAIEAGRPQRLGHGAGPLDPLFAIRRTPPPA